VDPSIQVSDFNVVHGVIKITCNTLGFP